MKICIVSEALEAPFDEGVKIYVKNFIKELNKKHEILCLGKNKNCYNEVKCTYTGILPKNKLLIGPNIYYLLKKFSPDVIYYIPPACATLFSFIRAKILKLYSKNSIVVLITLQPRNYKKYQKALIPMILPDLAFAQTNRTIEILTKLKCKTKKIFIGVDTSKFFPVKSKTKSYLKTKYGINKKKYVVLHVGHINRNRNMQVMGSLQEIDNIQAVAVGSTSYPEDIELANELRQKGVIILDKYLPNIQEIYQASDCYIFPVFSETGCIEIPLSIFEALACNLSIITTNFGELPNIFQPNERFIYVNKNEQFIDAVKKMQNTNNLVISQDINRFSWENMADRVVYDTKNSKN